jgi:tetratricopeptide (TPR) repeat protein
VISLVVRAGLLVLLGFAATSALRQWAARQMYDLTPGIDGVLDALAWDPSRAKYHAEAGVLFRDELELMDVDRAVTHLERAVELLPYSGSHWVELARAYERAGRLDDAEPAYLRSIELEQPATDYRWEVANFYMRRERPDLAFEHLQRTVAEEPEYMESALALLVRGGFSLDEIERAWPQDQTSRLALLRLSAAWQAGAHAGVGHEDVVALWERLLAADPPPTVEAGDAFVRHLFETGRHADARRAWNALAARNGLVDPAYASGSNDVWDGEFEHGPVQAAMAWRTWPGEGFDVARVPGEGETGTTALRLAFDGSRNVHLGNVEQLVLLEPGQRYELGYATRRDGLTTEEGPRVEVFDRRGERILYRGESLTGTAGWTRHVATFDVPDDCGAALVRVVRLPSRRIAGEIAGTFWVDDVRLSRAGSRDSPAATARGSGARR